MRYRSAPTFATCACVVERNQIDVFNRLDARTGSSRSKHACSAIELVGELHGLALRRIAREKAHLFWIWCVTWSLDDPTLLLAQGHSVLP